MAELRGRGRRVAAVVGDLATDNDARRLAASGAPARQIITGTVCHLEANMVGTSLEGWDLAEYDYLFIENVGNLVCPASFDRGEDLRVLLFPVTEGEDKPLKYPILINTADVTLISKLGPGRGRRVRSRGGSEEPRRGPPGGRRPRGFHAQRGGDRWLGSTAGNQARRQAVRRVTADS
jgi:hydrogenase nickel incorporation protein HypB